MKEEEKAYPFIVVARLREDKTVREIEVQVFDPDDGDPLPLPIAEGSAPAYGDDGLATAVYRAFADLQIPPVDGKVLPEVDDLIRSIEEERGEDINA